MTTQEMPSADTRRVLLLALLLTFGAAAIVAQLFRYQILQHAELTAESNKLVRSRVTFEPPRGCITDINGNILAMDVVEWEVSANPPYVTDVKEESKILAPLLGLSEQTLEAALAKKASLVTLKADVSQETCHAIQALRLEGIGCALGQTALDTESIPTTAISPTWVITGNPSAVAEPMTIAAQIAPLLGRSVREVREQLLTKAPWVLLAASVPLEIGESIRMNEDLDGIRCAVKYHRLYPQADLTSHILGFVNANRHGYYGIEGCYNAILTPTKGTVIYEQTPGGDRLPTGTQQQDPSRQGTSLVLTLDLNIQYIAQEELEQAIDRYGAEGGTVIVMEPTSGAILAMVSHPRYDPNKYAESAPLSVFDPAISGTWEPGSVFKLVTWAAALDQGSITPDTIFHDTACIEVGGRDMCNWDNEGHGDVSAREALGRSLNVVAAQISTGMGAESFYTYVRRIGFGSLTGVDLASEVQGTIREPGDSDWFPSDLGANSFGQGLAVTPIQMITAVSAIANGGLLVRPHAVAQLVMPEDGGGVRTVQVEPAAVRRAISEEAARQLTDMMVDAVDSFATKAQVPGYRIAGKSSTASIPTPYGYDLTKTIASYVGFAPADDPQFVLLVKLDKPTASEWGTQTAAPTFKAIAERLFLYLKIPPDRVRLAESQP